MIRLLIVALLVMGGTVAVLAVTFKQPLRIDESTFLLVERGDNINRLASALEASLPMPPLVFRAYARLTAPQGHIQAGEYELQPGITAPRLLALLRSGNVVQRQVTFPEGWTVSQWLDLLTETPFLVNNSRTELLNSIGEPSAWEGYLYPDTYAYTRGESAKSILDRAKSKMNRVLTEVWENRSGAGEVSDKSEALILASVIEKETGYDLDRPLVASVFNNRLARGMKLQSDPTVIYGLEDFDGDLRRRHLKIDHPYNTYVIRGLPVAPICNPGRASLEAALNPPASPYLYFVAQGDGRSYFSTTLEEHNQAVIQYQKTGRVENYRSAPGVTPH